MERFRFERMERLKMQALVGAALCGLSRTPPGISAWDLRIGDDVELLAATGEGLKRIPLNEQRLRRYAYRFDYERACRWLLAALRQGPAA